jgi:hypothetical protein
MPDNLLLFRNGRLTSYRSIGPAAGAAPPPIGEPVAAGAVVEKPGPVSSNPGRVGVKVTDEPVLTADFFEPSLAFARQLFS